MRFCQNPFTRMEVHDNGDCHFCCHAWLPTPIGNIFENSLSDIWNGPKAQEIRASIYDNTFRFCKVEHCEHLQKTTLPMREISQVEEFHFLEIIQERKLTLDFGPTVFSANYDKSCNLSCPTCRSEIQATPLGKNPNLQKIHQEFLEILPHLSLLKITGSGDPFGSPYFNQLLKTMKTSELPNLKILLQTNAQLLTKEKWDSLANIHSSIDSIDISIDAATEETYSINRRGGSFSRLMKNLEFLSQIRQEQKISNLIISFVVQKNNWREMKNFVEIGRKFQVDEVRFTRLSNWGTFTESELADRQVHIGSHPEFFQLKTELKNPIFLDPIVNISNLTQIFEPEKCKNGFKEAAHPEPGFQKEYSLRV